MSRIGKQPIEVPKEVEVEIKDRIVTIKGPKGKLSLNFSSSIEVKYQNSKISVQSLTDDKLAKSNWGTTRAILNNMVRGVIEGFKKELEIVGIGYKAQMKGKDLVLQIGFSQPIQKIVPAGLKVFVPTPNRIVIEGIDKDMVGQFAANIRKIYPPEPYKGKGIRYLGEGVRKKLGKAMAK